jgi:hypothetical protein
MALRAAEPANSHYNEAARWAVIHHAMYAVIDILIAPFFLVAVAVPWRSAAVLEHVSALVGARAEAEMDYHCAEARFEVCAHAFHALLDIAVAPFFVVALAPLWRTHAVMAHFKVPPNCQSDGLESR